MLVACLLAGLAVWELRLHSGKLETCTTWVVAEVMNGVGVVLLSSYFSGLWYPDMQEMGSSLPWLCVQMVSSIL